MSVLLALFGPKRGVRLEITEQATLGRSSDADLQLVDGKVSRLHCRFSVRRGRLEVEDLGSNNGTYVNGQRLTAARRLAPGDEIAVGDSLFLADSDDDAAAARFGDTTLIVSHAAPETPQARPAAESPAPGPAPLLAAAALAGVLRACADQESAARAVLAAMEQSLAPTRAFVLLWDDKSGLARPLVGRAADRVVAVSRTLLDRAAAHRRGIAVQDAVADRVLRQARSVVRHQIRAVAVAPILMADAVVGFLYADRAQPGYQADDAALLQCFAATFALGGHLPSSGATTTAQAGTGKTVAPAADQPVGNSPAWREVLRVATAAAAASSTVLISGPSGTGKEEIARFIHRRSARAAGPFVAVNCGAIPEALAESELFGHEKGAFTGALATRIGYLEAADGGTLFLDELGELPAAQQVKLLRVLQERVLSRVGSTIPLRVNLRVVAATHRDLDADVRAGRFREDLFYRVAVIRVQLPALKDRPQDIAPLARALLARVAAELGRRDPGLDATAEKALAGGRWPGNARQLSNALERALVLRPSEDLQPLSADDLRGATAESDPLGGDRLDERPTAAAGALGEKVAALERAEIEAALRRSRGVKSRAATALGLSRPTLDKKLAELGINLWKQAE